MTHLEIKMFALHLCEPNESCIVQEKRGNTAPAHTTPLVHKD